MRALAYRIVLAGPAARAAIAVVAGAVGALAMPPFGIWPALALSLVPLVWLLDGAAAGERFRRLAALRRAAFAGWFWGFGYFVAGLWWIGAAFLVEADVFAWLMPFGVLGLPALLAVFPALGTALASLVWSRGAGRIVALAAGLGLAEWLRGHVLTGFPWNALGLAFGQNVTLAQMASLVGQDGLTLLAVLVCAAPATLATGETARGRAGPSAAAALGLSAMTLFGLWRVPAGPVPDVPGVRLRIMQPNLPQDAKFRPDAGPEILRRYLALSDRATTPGTPGLSGVTHLIWPESAFPFLLNREPAALGEIGRALPDGTVLITGAAREGAALPGESGRRFFNAIQVVARPGVILSGYDKVHLVPFGEYVPHALDRVLRALGVRQFVHIPGGFTPGEARLALVVPGLPPAAAAVCYEAIFPDEIMPPGGTRPGLILNVTNDGWFGDTPGPRQHFAQARLRAIEHGLPLVRAANTGISAVVDPYGRVTAFLPVGQEGVLDAGLPSPISSPLADGFDRIGIWMLALIWLAAIARTAIRGRSI